MSDITLQENTITLRQCYLTVLSLSFKADGLIAVKCFYQQQQH